MSNVLNEYFDALDRLILKQPRIVPKGTKISNDAVALEAGRRKGSIKKSRAIFSQLIDAIRAAADTPANLVDDPKKKLENRLGRAKASEEQYRRLYEETLGRELSLLYELHELKQELEKLKPANIIPLRD